MGFNIESLKIGPESNFCYLIECLQTGFCALVDPAFEAERVKAHFFSNPKRKLKYLIATHGHWDHAGGFPEMKSLFPEALVVAHASEKSRLQKLQVNLDQPMKDGDFIELGEVKIRILHTPGHTEGGACYYLKPYLFTGDTLFVGLCGRTDLPGGSDELLFESLQRLKSLPSETIVLPGHDYGATPRSTLKAEAEQNPAMVARTLEDFIAIP